jgi:hypothetical protein
LVPAADADRLVITNGLAEFEKYSCILFVPRAEEKTYVDIVKGSSCWSVLGHRQGAGEFPPTAEYIHGNG